MYESWLIQVLLALVTQAPVLLVLVAGVFLMLNHAPPGKVRALGATGLAIALGSHLLASVVMALLPRILLEWAYFSYEVVRPMLWGVRFMFELFEALGYGLLLWAMLQALRQLRDTSGTAVR